MTTIDLKNAMNVMWDYWYEGISQIYNGQKQFENLFLQSLSKQKEAWEILNDQVDFYSKSLKEEIVYYNSKAADVFGKAGDDSTKERIQEVQKQLDDVMKRLSNNSITSQDIVNQWIKGIGHVEKIAEEIINQQEKNRIEIKDMIENYIQEINSSMDKMNETFEELFNKNLTYTK